MIVQPTLQVQHDIQCFPCSCNFNNNIIMSLKLVTSFQTDCLNRNLCCNLVLILRCFVTICGESEIYCFSIAVSEKRNYCLNFRNVSCSLTLRWRREFFFSATRISVCFRVSLLDLRVLNDRSSLHLSCIFCCVIYKCYTYIFFSAFYLFIFSGEVARLIYLAHNLYRHFPPPPFMLQAFSIMIYQNS